jgi:hypothetical protein
MTPPQQQKRTALDYHSPPDQAPVARGATGPARVLAGVACVVFARLAFGIWAGAESYERLPARPAITLSLAASGFCAAVALGWIGRHKVRKPRRGDKER